MLPKFELIQPVTMKEALEAIHGDKTYLLISGGTDVLVRLRAGVPMGKKLMSLLKIEDLKIIEEDEDWVHVGAACVFSDLENHPIILEKVPLLAKAASLVGSPAIRNRATVGGNVENASPAGDSLVALYGQNAEVILTSIHGERIIPISEYILAPRKTMRQPDEIIREIRIPKNNVVYKEFFKCGRRNALAISVVNGCVCGDVELGKLNHVKVFLGAVAPTPIELKCVGDLVNGKEYTRELDKEVQTLIENSIHPIDDVRASKEYRRYIAGVYVRRCLRKLAGWEEAV